MIDITEKEPVIRIATAAGKVFLKPSTIEKITKKRTEKKGDILENARYAAILAVKQTPHLIFMAHPIAIHGVDVEFDVQKDFIGVQVTVKTRDRTGVELEAMMGVLNALMAIFDMVKPEEKDEHGQYPVAKITDVHVVTKIKKLNK